MVVQRGDLEHFAIGVWPIRRDSHSGETFLLDGVLSDLGALPIKLVRTVRCLAKQNKAGIANEREERLIVCGCACKRMCHSLELSAEGRLWHDSVPPAHPVCARAAGLCAACASKSQTSASLICSKFSYHRPTA